MKPTLLLQGGTVICSDRETLDDVLVRDGVVEEVDRFVEEFDKLEEVKGKLLFPGLIDCHVHFRDPGFPEKATMATEATAAFAGGVTTVCDMPNTSPPTVTVAALADKVRRAADIKNVDMRFFFGVTEDIHIATLRELFATDAEESVRLRSRIAGVKIYLDHSTGNQKVEENLLDEIFEVCAEYGITLVAHCEDPAENQKAALQNTRQYVAAHSLIRPASSEAIAIERAIAYAKKHGTHLHIAHLSTEQGIELVKQAKEEGLPITCEVTPHHLFLTTDDYEILGTRGKMNPPLRSQKHRMALWKGIEDGVVDCISTDHAPHTLEEKKAEKDLEAPSGVPGVETMFPLLLSVAAGHWPHPKEQYMTPPPFSYQDIVRLCVANPSQIFSLGKHEIREDAAVDIVLVDPEKEWTIRGEDLHYKCGWTPFEGWTVKGKVEKVMKA